jgi:hypothetical protein
MGPGRRYWNSRDFLEISISTPIESEKVSGGLYRRLRQHH